jgi:hypothetical protein
MYQHNSLSYDDVTRITEQHIALLLPAGSPMSPVNLHLRTSMARGVLSIWTHLVTQLGSPNQYDADVDRLEALLTAREQALHGASECAASEPV